MKAIRIAGAFLLLVISLQGFAAETQHQQSRAAVDVIAVNTDQAQQLRLERDRQQQELAALRAEHSRRIDSIIKQD